MPARTEPAPPSAADARPVKINKPRAATGHAAPTPLTAPAAHTPPARTPAPPRRPGPRDGAAGAGGPGPGRAGPPRTNATAAGPHERRACVLGIDPGFAGGLAFVTLGGEAVKVAPMPALKGKGKTELDVPGLVGLIRSVQAGHDVTLVVVERVHSMPGQGVASTFAFGRNFGEVLGAVKALGLPLEMPLPQAWKKAVLAGTPGDKLAAVQYAARRFPTASLLATPLSRTPSDGIADALCLAEWGRRLALGTASGAEQGSVPD